MTTNNEHIECWLMFKNILPRGPELFINKLTCWLTSGPYYHVELVFGIDVCDTKKYEAFKLLKRVYGRDVKVSNPPLFVMNMSSLTKYESKKWEAYRVMSSPTNLEACHNFCLQKLHEGVSFNLTGYKYNFIFGTNYGSRGHKYFCSQFCYEALVNSGLMNRARVKPHKMHVNQFHDLIVKDVQRKRFRLIPRNILHKRNVRCSIPLLAPISKKISASLPPLISTRSNKEKSKRYISVADDGERRYIRVSKRNNNDDDDDVRMVCNDMEYNESDRYYNEDDIIYLNKVATGIEQCNNSAHDVRVRDRPDVYHNERYYDRCHKNIFVDVRNVDDDDDNSNVAIMSMGTYKEKNDTMVNEHERVQDGYHNLLSLTEILYE